MTDYGDISHLSEAERQRVYEAHHVAENSHRKTAVYNPYEKPVEELPTIFGFNNGGRSGWLDAVLMSEDGHHLGGHICSSEAYMRHDLGILEGARDDRHEGFRKHYPDGYKMEFVPYAEFGSHAGLQAALAKYKERFPS